MNLQKTIFSRSISYPGKIYIVDGLTGTGKTLLTRLLSEAINAEIPRFNYTFEQVCILNKFGCLDSNSSSSILKLMIDQQKYDLAISREVNFRIGDLSSALKSSKRFDYILRLFSKDGADVQDRLQNNQKQLILVTHQLLDSTEIVHKTFRQDFYQIICTRHPIYLYDHWLTYIDLFGKSARDLTLWKKYRNSEIPWFINSKELWFYGNLEEKSVIAICDLTNRLLQLISSMKKEQNILVIEFEKMVTGQVNLKETLKAIGISVGSNYRAILKSERVPRSHINSGKKRKIYLRYGSQNLSNILDHKTDYFTRKNQIIGTLGKEYRQIFLEVIEKYESKFSLWF